MKRKKLLTKATITKSEDGRRTETSIYTVNSVSEPSFCKLYTGNIDKIASLPGRLGDLVLLLSVYLGYDGLIRIDGDVKEKVSNIMGIKRHTINNKLVLLMKYNILKRKNRGVYMVNPSIISKGNYKDSLELKEKYEGIL